jgi:hypothetical protein
MEYSGATASKCGLAGLMKARRILYMSPYGCGTNIIRGRERSSKDGTEPRGDPPSAEAKHLALRFPGRRSKTPHQAPGSRCRILKEGAANCFGIDLASERCSASIYSNLISRRTLKRRLVRASLQARKADHRSRAPAGPHGLRPTGARGVRNRPAGPGSSRAAQPTRRDQRLGMAFVF